jgi:hypothetical protein
VSKKTTVDRREAIENPESILERKLIAEYLLSKGYKMTDLKNLSEIEAGALIKEACLYATLKLAEIEAKSKFRRKIEMPH